MRRLLIAALTLSAIDAVAAGADEKPRVAILDLTIEGDAPPELRAQLDKSLAGGLASAGYGIVARDEVAKKLKSSPQLVGCVTTTCLARVGDVVKATRFIRARVEANGAAYTIDLELLGADGADALVKHVSKSCPVCTIAEANDAMSKGAVELFAAGPAMPDKPPPRQITVETDPPGCAIELDGVHVDGVTPMQLTIATPGDHTLRATMDGRQPVEQKLAPDAMGAKLSLPPVTVVKSPPPPPASSSRWGAWKWVAAGVGVAALGAGIALVAINDKCTDSVCMNLYSTGGGGAALIVVGVAASAAAVYFFATDRPHNVEAAVVPTKGGAAAWLGVRF
jgi:hypothetical protein